MDIIPQIIQKKIINFSNLSWRGMNQVSMHTGEIDLILKLPFFPYLISVCHESGMWNFKEHAFEADKFPHRHNNEINLKNEKSYVPLMVPKSLQVEVPPIFLKMKLEKTP